MYGMTLLGTGTAVPDADRECTHMVWRAPDGPLLIDAGGSTYQRLLRADIDPLTLRGVVLTHSHADHINGIPSLLFALKLAGFAGQMPIYGDAPTLALVRRVLTAFDLEGYQAQVAWTEVQAGQDLPLANASYRVRTAPTVHSRPCFGMRFETPDGALTYSADTEPCAAILELARGSAALIHEATTPGSFAGHTSPRQAGEVAAAAGVGRLVLVHFSPKWTMSEAQALAEMRAGGFAGPASVGREFETIGLG